MVASWFVLLFPTARRICLRDVKPVQASIVDDINQLLDHGAARSMVQVERSERPLHSQRLHEYIRSLPDATLLTSVCTGSPPMYPDDGALRLSRVVFGGGAADATTPTDPAAQGRHSRLL
jgi:hypothetical protein